VPSHTASSHEGAEALDAVEVDAHVLVERDLAALPHDAMHSEQRAQHARQAGAVLDRDHLIIRALGAALVRAEVRDELRAGEARLAQLEAAGPRREVSIDLLVDADPLRRDFARTLARALGPRSAPSARGSPA
jgi:hypothetical protein